MTPRALVFLAIGLAMDSTAAAAARGLSAPQVRVRDAVRVALYFGGFQALMPLVGYGVGAWVGPSLAAFDHWIAFVVLGGLGAKMLWEARGDASDEDAEAGEAGASPSDPFSHTWLLSLAVATSIDALVVGVTLPMLGAPLGLSLLVIGLTAGLCSAAGLYAGRALGATIGPRLDAAGGLVLIGLGTKILLEHLSQA